MTVVSPYKEVSNMLQEEVGALMHHDTITGTSQVRVIKFEKGQIKEKMRQNS